MNVIELRDVSKSFRAVSTRRIRTWRQVRALLERERVTALRGVTFNVPDGASVGIVGNNGAGKSTLLRVISGLTRQDSGTVRVNRRVSGLLTLGEAFQHDLTGEENAVTQAILAGLTRREALRRLPAIADFSELDDVLDQPLRTYSDGMRLRLAFAVAINVRPEVLMIDELLAVGDVRFRQRCLDRLDELSSDGVTTLLTSHDMSQVQRMCSRVIWLRDGRVEMTGTTDHVLEAYAQATADPPPCGDAGPIGGTLSVGGGPVRIRAVRLLSARSRTQLAGILPGAGLEVVIDAEADHRTPDVAFSVDIHPRDADHGRAAVNVTTGATGGIVVDGPTSVRCRIERLDLAAGRYVVSAGAFPGDWSRTFDYRWDAAALSVTGPSADALMTPPCDWVVDQPSTTSTAAGGGG